MAMTLKEIKALMDELNLKCHLDEERGIIGSGWATDNYKNMDGDKGIRVLIRVEEDGEYIKIFSPSVYKYKEGPNMTAVLQACMYVSWRTKMVQFEYDPSDGEIRAIIEFPLEDGKITAKQLRRMVGGLSRIIDEYDPMIRKAMETGQFVPEKGESGGVEEALSRLTGVDPDEVRALLEEVKKRKQGGAGGGASEEKGGRPTEL
jgi:hypothetical protein